MFRYDVLQLHSPRYRLEAVGNAGNGDGALDVAGQDCQAGFCGNVLETVRSEVAGAHPAPDAAEDMFERTVTDRHRFMRHFQPALHGIEYRLMLPSLDALLPAGCAQGAGWACAAGLLIEVNPDKLPALDKGKALLQQLAGRAAVGVGLWLIIEHGLAPETSRLSR